MAAGAETIAGDAKGDQPFDRALAVLDVVTASAQPISITDIAGECKLPVPTVHRLVAQLERRNLLRRVIGSRKLVVGSGLVDLGIGALQAAIRGDRSHQILVSFVHRIGEYAQIACRSDDNWLIYLDTARAPESTVLRFDRGRRLPLHCTSIGKLFLAEMADDDLDAWLAQATLDARAPKTIVRPDALRQDVLTVRKTGWATNDEELEVGLVGCAVPIRSADGRLIAGLGVSVPLARMSVHEVQELVPTMKATAAEIAAAVLAKK